MKDYKVVMRIEAPSKKAVDRWIEDMPHSEDIWDCKIIDEDERHYEARIRFVEDWCGRGEHFIFEERWSDEEWGLALAFKLLDYGDEKNVLLNYTALTKIREYQRLNIPFYFGE